MLSPNIRRLQCIQNPAGVKQGEISQAVNHLTPLSSFLSSRSRLEQVAQALKCVTPAGSSSKARIRLLIMLRSGGLIGRGCKIFYQNSTFIVLRLAFRQTGLCYLPLSAFTLIGKDTKHICQFLNRQLGLLLTPVCLIQPLVCTQNNSHLNRISHSCFPRFERRADLSLCLNI